MPKGNKNLIQSLRSAHDPHFKLEGRVEELEKKLPIQIADLHKTLSKSFGMQRKTLVRVLGLEKKIEELQAVKEKVEEVVEDIGEDKIEEVVEDIKEEKAPEEETSEEEIPEGLDDVLDDIRGEKEEGGTETKKPAATKKKPRKKPTARKIPTKKPVAKKKKISAESLKKGTVLDPDFKSRVMGEDEKGEYLSPEERKIRFKKSKISADSIRGVDKSQNPDISGIFDGKDDKKTETEGLKGIRDVLDDILKVLRLDFKGDRKEARDDQKVAAQDKRDKREGKLEGGGIKKSVGLIGKGLKAVVSPFTSIWDSVINFIKFTLIGVLFNKAMKWFNNPKNQGKAKSIGKFFKDWWPTLATAAALFLTPLGGLVKGVVGLLTAIIPKIVMAIAANPFAALALVGTGLVIWGISKMANKKQDNKGGGEVDEGEGEGVTTERTSQSFTTRGGPEAEQLKNQMAERRGEETQGFKQGGLVNDQTSAQNFVQKFNEGGLVRGYGMGEIMPDQFVYNKQEYQSTYKTKGGEVIKDASTFTDIGGAIGMPDLQEHQTQLVKSLRQVPGYENINFMDVVQYPDGKGRLVSMPEETLYPILNASDAAQATNAKIDAGNQKFMEDNDLINSDGSVKGYSYMDGKLKVDGETRDAVLGDGAIKKFNKGGKVPGSGNKDTVPAMLTPGEFVMSKGAVGKYGMDTLENMNAAAGSGSSSKKKDTVPAMLTPGEFVVSAPAVQQYGVDTMESMNLKGGGNNKPEIKVGANNGGLINNYNDIVNQYQGGGVVEAPSLARGLLIKLIKKVTNKNMDPVGIPVPPAKNTTITLPTITKNKPEETTTSQNDIPKFRVSMISTQRSMVISSLGISDLVGG